MKEWIAATPWWVFVALIAALGTALFRVSRWAGKVDATLASIDTRLVSMKAEVGSVKAEVGSVKTELGSMKTELGSMKTEIGSVGTKLDILSGAVSEMTGTLKGLLQRPTPALAPGSPLRLTELGHRISDRVGAGEVADSLSGTLRPRAEGLPAYDIQELSFAYARNEWRPPEATEAAIRECAYESGVARDVVMDVIAIELRDRLLPTSA